MHNLGELIGIDHRIIGTIILTSGLITVNVQRRLRIYTVVLFTKTSTCIYACSNASYIDGSFIFFVMREGEDGAAGCGDESCH